MKAETIYLLAVLVLLGMILLLAIISGGSL